MVEHSANTRKAVALRTSSGYVVQQASYSSRKLLKKNKRETKKSSQCGILGVWVGAVWLAGKPSGTDGLCTRPAELSGGDWAEMRYYRHVCKRLEHLQAP